MSDGNKRAVRPSAVRLPADARSLLAEHMLPDGAHDRADDWTVFYLNQVPELTVDPKLLQQHHLEHPDAVSLAGTPRPDERPGELLYVLSLVRTKKVATVRRYVVRTRRSRSR